jgi:hypothetical protein
VAKIVLGWEGKRIEILQLCLLVCLVVVVLILVVVVVDVVIVKVIFKHPQFEMVLKS